MEYQETLKIDVKNIAKNKKQYGDQYMKLFMLDFEETIVLQNSFRLM